jgi:hypothetical protein
MLDDHGGWLLLAAALLLVALASADGDDAVAGIFASGSIALFLAAAFYGRIRGRLGVGSFNAGHIDSARVLDEAAESAEAHALGPDAVPDLVRAAGGQHWPDNLVLLTLPQHAALDRARQRIDARAERLAWARRAGVAVRGWLSANGYHVLSQGLMGLRAGGPDGEVLVGLAEQPSVLSQTLRALSAERSHIRDRVSRGIIVLGSRMDPVAARRRADEIDLPVDFFVLEGAELQPLK